MRGLVISEADQSSVQSSDGRKNDHCLSARGERKNGPKSNFQGHLISRPTGTLSSISMDSGGRDVKITGRLSLIFSPLQFSIWAYARRESDGIRTRTCDLDRVPGCRYPTGLPYSANDATFSTRSGVTIRLSAVSKRERLIHRAETFFRSAAGNVSQAVRNTSLGALFRVLIR
jgi:hypothetical protein